MIEQANGMEAIFAIISILGSIICGVLWAIGARAKGLPLSWIILGCIFITWIVGEALS